MSLINCPECNHEVSSTVKRCPNCGYRFITHKVNIVPIQVLISILSTAFIASAVYIYSQINFKYAKISTHVTLFWWNTGEIVSIIFVLMGIILLNFYVFNFYAINTFLHDLLFEKSSWYDFHKSNYKNIISCSKFILKEYGNQLIYSEVLVLVTSFMSSKKRDNSNINKDELYKTTYIIIGNCICNALSSGRYHIYRGTLSLTGNNLYQFYLYILNKSKELSIISENDYNELLDSLSSNISEIG